MCLHFFLLVFPHRLPIYTAISFSTQDMADGRPSRAPPRFSSFFSDVEIDAFAYDSESRHQSIMRLLDAFQPTSYDAQGRVLFRLSDEGKSSFAIV